MLNFFNISEAGERAFGPFENPLFVRTSGREQANQIFVDGYMSFIVVRYANWHLHSPFFFEGLNVIVLWYLDQYTVETQ